MMSHGMPGPHMAVSPAGGPMHGAGMGAHHMEGAHGAPSEPQQQHQQHQQQQQQQQQQHPLPQRRGSHHSPTK